MNGGQKICHPSVLAPWFVVFNVGVVLLVKLEVPQIERMEMSSSETKSESTLSPEVP